MCSVILTVQLIGSDMITIYQHAPPCHGGNSLLCVSQPFLQQSNERFQELPSQHR